MARSLARTWIDCGSAWSARAPRPETVRITPGNQFPECGSTLAFEISFTASILTIFRIFEDSRGTSADVRMNRVHDILNLIDPTTAVNNRIRWRQAKFTWTLSVNRKFAIERLPHSYTLMSLGGRNRLLLKIPKICAFTVNIDCNHRPRKRLVISRVPNGNSSYNCGAAARCRFSHYIAEDFDWNWVEFVLFTRIFGFWVQKEFFDLWELRFVLRSELWSKHQL